MQSVSIIHVLGRKREWIFEDSQQVSTLLLFVRWAISLVGVSVNHILFFYTFYVAACLLLVLHVTFLSLYYVEIEYHLYSIMFIFLSRETCLYQSDSLFLHESVTVIIGCMLSRQTQQMPSWIFFLHVPLKVVQHVCFNIVFNWNNGGL